MYQTLSLKFNDDSNNNDIGIDVMIMIMTVNAVITL